LALQQNDVVETKTLADGTVSVRNARGAALLRRLGPGVVFFVCSGSFSESMHPPMLLVAQQELDAHGTLVLFVDGQHLRSVDTGYREAWTVWFKANRHRFHMQLLVRTKLMEMAASIANLLSGGAVIATYSSVRDWERACIRDFPAFHGAQRATG
jgi:hypothetical protein